MIFKQVAFRSSLFIIVFTVPFKILFNKADTHTFVNPVESRSAMAPYLVYLVGLQKNILLVQIDKLH